MEYFPSLLGIILCMFCISHNIIIVREEVDPKKICDDNSSLHTFSLIHWIIGVSISSDSASSTPSTFERSSLRNCHFASSLFALLSFMHIVYLGMLYDEWMIVWLAAALVGLSCARNETNRQDRNKRSTRTSYLWLKALNVSLHEWMNGGKREQRIYIGTLN